MACCFGNRRFADVAPGRHRITDILLRRACEAASCGDSIHGDCAGSRQYCRSRYHCCAHTTKARRSMVGTGPCGCRSCSIRRRFSLDVVPGRDLHARCSGLRLEPRVAGTGGRPITWGALRWRRRAEPAPVSKTWCKAATLAHEDILAILAMLRFWAVSQDGQDGEVGQVVRGWPPCPQPPRGGLAGSRWRRRGGGTRRRGGLVTLPAPHPAAKRTPPGSGGDPSRFSTLHTRLDLTISPTEADGFQAGKERG